MRLPVLRKAGPADGLEIVVEYLAKRDEWRSSDLILGLGSACPHVPVHAAALYRLGLAPWVLFSGGVGRLTESWMKNEAAFMRERAIRSGVPASRILVEDRSTNTMENLLFSEAVMKALGLRVRRALITTQPVMQRRAWATAARLWPEVEWISAPPPVSLDSNEAAAIAKRALGEIERLERYGRAGYVVEETIPAAVKRAAAQRLY